MSKIGTLNEKSLHAALKEWYAQPGDRFEVPLDRYVIDIVRGDVLIEIQTRNFASMKSKLIKLVESHKLRLVYPIAQEKWIIKPDKDAKSARSQRRKSPKRGKIEDLFIEMVSFPSLLQHPNFTLEVLMIEEEERRHFVGKRRWRQKGWGVEERSLLRVIEQHTFTSPGDWQQLLPGSLPTEFTTKDLVEAAGLSKMLSQKMVYCLRNAAAIEAIGKRGRFNLFRILHR